VPAGRRCNHCAASRITGRNAAIMMNSNAMSTSGPKLAIPSAFCGRPATSAPIQTETIGTSPIPSPATTMSSVPSTVRHQRLA
jgi:hypothetical protein